MVLEQKKLHTLGGGGIAHGGGGTVPNIVVPEIRLGDNPKVVSLLEEQVELLRSIDASLKAAAAGGESPYKAKTMV